MTDNQRMTDQLPVPLPAPVGGTAVRSPDQDDVWVDEVLAGLRDVAGAQLRTAYTAGRAHERAVLVETLVGVDDVPGVLDRFEVRATDGLVVWYCPRGHGDGGVGHVAVIARNLDGDQTGLTLGELVEAALTHEDEEHDGLQGA